MFRKPNPSSGVPIYVQLKEQVRHAIETGALCAGDQLPGIRSLAETLVINPNTVIKVYRELEQEGLLEIRHGLARGGGAGGERFFDERVQRQRIEFSDKTHGSSLAHSRAKSRNRELCEPRERN